MMSSSGPLVWCDVFAYWQYPGKVDFGKDKHFTQTIFCNEVIKDIKRWIPLPFTLDLLTKDVCVCVCDPGFCVQMECVRVCYMACRWWSARQHAGSWIGMKWRPTTTCSMLSAKHSGCLNAFRIHLLVSSKLFDTWSMLLFTFPLCKQYNIW